MSLNNIHFILVRPQIGENIGSVARAIKNFNIKYLRIVKPRCNWPNQKALVTSGLESAKKAEALGLTKDKIIISCKVSELNTLIEVYDDLAGAISAVLATRKDVNGSIPEKIYLTNGGHICDIKIINKQIQILCKNSCHRLFQIKFDESVIFQRITPQEAVILQILDYLDPT